MLSQAASSGSLSSLFAWWLTLLCCGLLAWPLAARLFPRSRDKAYLIAKPFGLLLAVYAAWLLASVGWISFEATGSLVGLSALAVTSYVSMQSWQPLHLMAVIRRELLFAALLSCGVVIRAMNPDIYGLEKFMDFAFMNAGVHAASMPPPDPWFAQSPINYYYFGHIVAAWTTLTSGVPTDHGYNLMMATLFAFSGALVYALVQDALPERARNTARAVGAMTAAAVVIGGNFHTVVYGAFRNLSGSSLDRDYYFPDSTRFIGFDPPTLDKAFTEMPAYGFAVGDMHGHVSCLPIGFLTLLAIYQCMKDVGNGDRVCLRVNLQNLILVSFLFGLLLMTNSWNFAIYGLFLILAGLLSWAAAPSLKAAELLKLAFNGIAILALSVAFAFPFLINFVPFGESIRWVERTTPLWQWITLYLHVLPGCAVALLLYAHFGWKQAPGVLAASLAATSLALLVLPEIVYLKDIYGADHMRANTMFKLTFQGQPIGIVASGLMIGLLLAKPAAGWKRLLPYALAIPLTMPLIYPYYWLRERVSNTPVSQYSLNGTGFMEREAVGEGNLARLVAALPLETGEIFLEAYGDSYTYAARFSAMTGRPTALGWPVHEWLWRGNWDKVAARMGQVDAVYRAQAADELCRALARLSVRYVIVGETERKKYPDIREGLLANTLDRIASEGKTSVFEVKIEACGAGRTSLKAK